MVNPSPRSDRTIEPSKFINPLIINAKKRIISPAKSSFFPFLIFSFIFLSSVLTKCSKK